MPEVMASEQLANRLADMASRLSADTHELREDGWKVSAQQLQNAVHLILDVERRLRNGDDWNG